MDTDTWRFLCACAGGEEPQHAFFAAEEIALADGGRANSAFFVHHNGDWYSYQTAPPWTAIAMTAVYERDFGRWFVVAVGQNGATWELQPRERTETLHQLPKSIGITNVATIGGSIYACGMGRVLLRRELSTKWSDLSAAWPHPAEGVIGFTAIAGCDQSLIYAIGWQGEIWTLSSGQWQTEQSSTNANLNSVAITDDGTVYAAGDNGAIVKGRQGSWVTIDTGTDFNLLDICVQDGAVYVCTDFEVFRLTDSGLETLDPAPDDLPSTCHKLVPAKGRGLYSVGPYDVFLRADGSWQRLA